MQSGSSYRAYVSYYGSIPKTGYTDGTFNTLALPKFKTLTKLFAKRLFFCDGYKAFLLQQFSPAIFFICNNAFTNQSLKVITLFQTKYFTMLLTTTPTIEGRPIQQYIGIVTSETIIGANIFKDLFAGIRDIVGGRSGTYERVIEEARQSALLELQQKAQTMGANAVVGVDLDFETVGSGGSMLMVVATGTAVKI